MSRRKIDTLVDLVLRRWRCACLIASVSPMEYEAELATIEGLWAEGIGLKTREKGRYGRSFGEQNGNLTGLPEFIECPFKQQLSYVGWQGSGHSSLPQAGPQGSASGASRPWTLPWNRGTLWEEGLHWPKRTMAWVTPWALEAPFPLLL